MKKLRRFISTVKYKWQSLFWLNAYNSPFIPLKLFVYFGDIKHSCPYFLPRYWKKFTYEDCVRKAEEAQKRVPPLVPFTHKPEYYKNYSKPVAIKYFGINLTGLGWKTKWDSYRFEYSPSISVVLFGKQFFMAFVPSIGNNSLLDSYWEAWLNYHYETDRKKSKKERLKELLKVYSCTWRSGTEAKGNLKETDYYLDILKPKYAEFYLSIKG